MKWIEFNQALKNNQELPDERRCVLVHFDGSESKARGIAVGYLRYAGGDKTCPYFVTPQFGGIPTHWCDSLGDDFVCPKGTWRH